MSTPITASQIAITGSRGLPGLLPTWAAIGGGTRRERRAAPERRADAAKKAIFVVGEPSSGTDLRRQG